MIPLNANITRENCGKCTRQIYIGQSAIICSKCELIFHANCLPQARIFRNQIYCEICIGKYDIIRYNPYYDEYESNDDRFYESEITGYTEMFDSLSELLENCRPYSSNELKQTLDKIDTLAQEKSIDSFSTYFQNLDGNETNFDNFVCSMAATDYKFSVVGIAETNIDPSEKDLYKLDNYNSCYQNKKEGKKKGTGVALYIHNKYSYTELDDVSQCSDNLESLFVKITDTAEPIIVGVIYRPPSGDFDIFQAELEYILASLPSGVRTHITGDYNVDLLDSESSQTTDFENVVISSGFTPTVSIHTHHRENCKKSCIDNILTNEPDNVVVSGTILSDCEHKPIFQVSFLCPSYMDQINESKQKIYYDYSKENIKKFCSSLKRNIENLNHVWFDTFTTIYDEAIDNACKLEHPRITKRTSVLNPWITAGIITSINQKIELYELWVKFKSHDLPDGDPEKYIKYKDHRKVLKNTIKLAKKLHYSNKFEKHKSDPKKTWGIINDLRGKCKKQLRSSFLVGEERITCRRAIANKFNEYFVNLASNLNTSLNSNQPGLHMQEISSFENFLGNKIESSIYLAETDHEEIEAIIKEFEHTGSLSNSGVF